MVSSRCGDRIGEELKETGIGMPEINQGVLEFQEELNNLELLQLKEALFDLGFEVLGPADNELLERISLMVKNLVYEKPEIVLSEYPAYVRQQLGFDDQEIMQVFSQVYGVDLLQYAVIQQVERIKEMILYEGHSLAEIVEILRFKDIPQLTRVFQKITGLKPAYYEKIRDKHLEVSKLVSGETDITCD